jgi:competence protein ComEA
MDVSERTALAGLALGSALFALALPDRPAERRACPSPGEGAARAGRTAEAICTGEGSELRGPARRLFGLAIDPNVADPLTLATLPGIGPVRARTIVRERERRPFRTLADLTRVRGLGPRSVERLAGLVAPAPAGPPACRPPCGGAGPDDWRETASGRPAAPEGPR